MPQIILNQGDIQKAMENYVATLGFKTEGKQISVEMTAGRKGNGFSATVDIADAPVLAQTQEVLRTETATVATVSEVVLAETTVVEEAVDTAKEVAVTTETTGEPVEEADDLFEQN